MARGIDLSRIERLKQIQRATGRPTVMELLDRYETTKVGTEFSQFDRVFVCLGGCLFVCYETTKVGTEFSQFDRLVVCCLFVCYETTKVGTEFSQFDRVIVCLGGCLFV